MVNKPIKYISTIKMNSTGGYDSTAQTQTYPIGVDAENIKYNENKTFREWSIETDEKLNKISNIYKENSLDMGKAEVHPSDDGEDAITGFRSLNFGENVLAEGDYSQSFGHDTYAIGDYSHAEGYSSWAEGKGSHAEGYDTYAMGNYSHAEGYDTSAEGDYSHAEGYNTWAEGEDSHAEGYKTYAGGNCSHAEGYKTSAAGDYSHAEGSESDARGIFSHAEGYKTYAGGDCSHASGMMTSAYNFQFVTGRLNEYSFYVCESPDVQIGDAFIVGNGVSSIDLENKTYSNAFKITYDGKVYNIQNYNSSNAGYAEYIYPWNDSIDEEGYPVEIEEDRVGYFVTIKDNFLYKATSLDSIDGITVDNFALLGNNKDFCQNKYDRDEFNRIIYEDSQLGVDPETGESFIFPNGKMKLKENFEFYIPKENNSAWSAVGLVGTMNVRQDGTCVKNAWCKSNDNGIATLADSRSFDTFKVIEVISDSVVKVLLK